MLTSPLPGKRRDGPAAQVVQEIVREMALQSKPTDKADAGGVIDKVAAILGGQAAVGGHGANEVYAAVMEWWARAYGDEISNFTRDDFDGVMTQARQVPPSERQKDADAAWEALWTRRQERPLLSFKASRISGRGEIVPRILQNINPQATDAVALTLLVRCLAPDAASRSTVLDFVQQYYPRAPSVAGCWSSGLHEEEAFAQVWEQEAPPGPYFSEALEEYLDIAIGSHEFIYSSLRNIMGKPVKAYVVDGGRIEFQLDFTHGINMHYRLDGTTREITSSEGRGVLHCLLGNGHVLRFFQASGGIQGLADLVKAENLGREMRYDVKGEVWRIFEPHRGIWREASKDEPVTILSRFLQRLLGPIKEHAECLGAAEFNWLRGEYAPTVFGDAGGDDEESDDGDSDEGPARKKARRARGRAPGKAQRKASASVEAEHALGLLKTVIYKYVETPKHTGEVLKPLQHLLAVDFSVTRDKWHLLPCPNGVADLKTGELLPKAAPDDLFTYACPTEYDPDADIGPARAFFANYFPAEAYEDAAEQQALVRCLQQWFGYCLTLETALELCVWFHGPGSNGKTVIAKLLEEVLGKVENGGIHSAIPIAALCRGRGEINGALSDAKHARHVTISEVDKSTQHNEATLRALVSGETQHFRQMYQQDEKHTPRLKLSMFVNWLPTWEDPEAHANRRRHMYVPMPRIFVNPDDPVDQIQIAEYRRQGKPECLIATKNVRYCEEQVLPHLQGFLCFFVLGAMEYYKNGRIAIPQSLKEHQKQELSGKPGAVAEYVKDNLILAPDAKLLQRDILADFRTVTQIGEISFKERDFNKALHQAITERGLGWEHVQAYNGRDGSGRAKSGDKGILYRGITFKDAAKAPWNKSEKGGL